MTMKPCHFGQLILPTFILSFIFILLPNPTIARGERKANKNSLGHVHKARAGNSQQKRAAVVCWDSSPSTRWMSLMVCLPPGGNGSSPLANKVVQKLQPLLVHVNDTVSLSMMAHGKQGSGSHEAADSGENAASGIAPYDVGGLPEGASDMVIKALSSLSNNNGDNHDGTKGGFKRHVEGIIGTSIEDGSLFPNSGLKKRSHGLKKNKKKKQSKKKKKKKRHPEDARKLIPRQSGLGVLEDILSSKEVTESTDDPENQPEQESPEIVIEESAPKHRASKRNKPHTNKRQKVKKKDRKPTITKLPHYQLGSDEKDIFDNFAKTFNNETNQQSTTTEDPEEYAQTLSPPPKKDEGRDKDSRGETKGKKKSGRTKSTLPSTSSTTTTPLPTSTMTIPTPEDGTWGIMMTAAKASFEEYRTPRCEATTGCRITTTTEFLCPPITPEGTCGTGDCYPFPEPPTPPMTPAGPIDDGMGMTGNMEHTGMFGIHTGMPLLPAMMIPAHTPSGGGDGGPDDGFEPGGMGPMMMPSMPPGMIPPMMLPPGGGGDGSDGMIMGDLEGTTTVRPGPGRFMMDSMMNPMMDPSGGRLQDWRQLAVPYMVPAANMLPGRVPFGMYMQQAMLPPNINGPMAFYGTPTNNNNKPATFNLEPNKNEAQMFPTGKAIRGGPYGPGMRSPVWVPLPMPTGTKKEPKAAYEIVTPSPYNFVPLTPSRSSAAFKMSFAAPPVIMNKLPASINRLIEEHRQLLEEKKWRGPPPAIQSRYSGFPSIRGRLQA